MRKSPAVARTLVLVLLVVAPSAAQQAGDASPSLHYTRKELNALRRDAKTVEQYQHLVGYFREQEREFRKQEAYQQELLADYVKDPVRYTSKYPTRGDSAKSRAAHYHVQAEKAAGLAREYERRAAELRARK